MAHPPISIIDDDESVRLATGGLIRSLGLVAMLFESAEDFLKSPQATSCVISDIQMPGMTGLDLQDYLIGQGHRIPIIFITAFPEEHIRKRAQEAGAVGFLSKPFDSLAMIKLLDGVLNPN